MIVLGISAHYHDSACAFVVDGRPVFALQEERLSRRRHDHRLPRRAILAGFRELRLTTRDVDVISYYEEPAVKLSRQLAMGMLTSAKHRQSGGSLNPHQPLDEIRDFLNWDGEISVQRHHDSHAAAAFFTSGFSSAAVMTADAVGEWDTTSFGCAGGFGLETLAAVEFPHSLGIFYSAITDFLGFDVNSDEFKVMGLASFGRPSLADRLARVVQRTEGLNFTLNQVYIDAGTHGRMYRDALIDLVGAQPRSPDTPPSQVHADIAASAQHVLEKVACELADELIRRTDEGRLIFSGGVALNCSLVRRLRELDRADDVYVPPAAGDAGSALGAALLTSFRHGDRPVAARLQSARLGIDHSDHELHRFLDRCSLAHRDFSDDPDGLAEQVALLLAGSAVIGWFQGRDEFGPRALGGRSILANPLSAEMRDIVNSRIKRREPFRPFAPVVQAERAAEFFDIEGESPFMTETFVARDARLPAVTHVDGTARVQTLTPSQDRRLYDLLAKFDQIAGVPVLLNTSFNLRGEPMVCSPADALACSLRCGLDYLVLGACVVDMATVPEDLRSAVPALERAERRRGVYTFF